MEKGTVTLLKAYTQDGKRFYLKTVWKDLRFEATILVGDTAWRGECTGLELRRLSTNFHEPEDVYFANIKLCLSMTSDQYLYELLQGCENTMLFEWKKKFADGTVMKYGSLVLDSREHFESFVDCLVDIGNQTKQELQASSTTAENLEAELNKALADIRQLVAVKNEMESNLYGKFVQLLNSKKRRIRVLEESLRNLKVSSDPFDRCEKT